MKVSGRTSLSWEDIVNAVRRDDRFEIVDFNLDILHQLDTSLEMHDSIIVATATLLRDSLDEDIALITRDKDIRDSGLVATVW